MTGANQQIVALFESSGLTPEQIAEATGFDETAVKAILLQNSHNYRKEARDDPSLQFTKDEAEEMKEIMLGIARYSEDEHLKAKMAKFIYEDKKGRLDNKTNIVKGNTFNIIEFNETMKKAIAAEKRTLEIVDAKVA